MLTFYEIHGIMYLSIGNEWKISPRHLLTGFSFWVIILVFEGKQILLSRAVVFFFIHTKSCLCQAGTSGESGVTAWLSKPQGYCFTQRFSSLGCWLHIPCTSSFKGHSLEEHLVRRCNWPEPRWLNLSSLRPCAKTATKPKPSGLTLPHRVMFARCFCTNLLRLEKSVRIDHWTMARVFSQCTVSPPRHEVGNGGDHSAAERQADSPISAEVVLFMAGLILTSVYLLRQQGYSGGTGRRIAARCVPESG